MAQKAEMTSIFCEDGRRLAATRCLCPDLLVTQVKKPSVQIAFGRRRKEFKLLADATPQVGDKLSLDSVFQIGDIVKVSAKSKGRGFAGVIKRHGFHRQPVSGGQSDRVRAPGAIGAQTPGKVVKGKKMPGHYGNAVATITGLKVISLDKDKKEIVISGPVPGHRRSWITINKLIKK